jgi:hypothetical protein
MKRQPKAVTRLNRSAGAYERLGHKATLAGQTRQATIYYAQAERLRKQASRIAGKKVTS